LQRRSIIAGKINANAVPAKAPTSEIKSPKWGINSAIRP